MKRVVLITGPMSVGKTTTGKLLCDRLGRAAFIDGDWCIDIHPFVGNKETKGMAIDNILYMTRNYMKCSECDTVVLSWVMSENTVSRIVTNLVDLEIPIDCVTLVCNQEALVERWHKDRLTEWRVDEWLEESVESISNYRSRANTWIIDTSALSLCNAVDEILTRLGKNTEVDKVGALL